MLYNLYLRQEFSMQSCTPTITLCKHNPGVMNLGQIWCNSHHLDTKLTLNCALNFVCESDTIRGWPFDSEGGGGLANLVGIDLIIIYFWHELGRKIYFLVLPRLEYLLSSATKFWKSKKKKAKKKKKKKTKGGRGGWNVGSEGRQDRIFQVIFFFIFLQTTGMCIQCMWMERLHAWFSFDYVYKEYIIESKTIVIEGGGVLGVSPENV